MHLHVHECSFSHTHLHIYIYGESFRYTEIETYTLTYRFNSYTHSTHSLETPLHRHGHFYDFYTQSKYVHAFRRSSNPKIPVLPVGLKSFPIRNPEFPYPTYQLTRHKFGRRTRVQEMGLGRCGPAVGVRVSDEQLRRRSVQRRLSV